MISVQLVKKILKKKYWIIASMLFVGVISAMYFHCLTKNYRSTVSFFIDDDEGHGVEFNRTDQNNLVLAKVANGNRLYHLARSTEMIDHLIKKFNLYDHYKIKQHGYGHYESITSLLQSKIKISPIEFNALSISVSDYDKVLAADIANEIFLKLDAMNKDFIISNIEKKIKIYDRLILKSRERSQEQLKELKYVISEFKSLMNNRNFIREDYFFSDIKLALSSLSTQLSSANNELLKTSQTYEILYASIEQENLPNLRLINYALPELREHFFMEIWLPFLLSCLTGLITFIFIGIFYENEIALNEIFN